MNSFYSFLRIIFFAGLSYLVLVTVAVPLYYIAEILFHNELVIILIKQSALLFSGGIIIFIFRDNNHQLLTGFKLPGILATYFVTIAVALSFFLVISFFDIVSFTIYKISDYSSFFKFLIFCTVPTFFTGFGEEIIFRWFLYKKLKVFLGNLTAILVSSLIFCIGHNWNLPNLLSAFTAGCLFAVIYHITDSISIPICIHSAWNFGQRFFFSDMSEYSYDAQRLVLLKVNDLKEYNWSEFFLITFILIGVVVYYRDNILKEPTLSPPYMISK
jgi:uncharacterized protein